MMKAIVELEDIIKLSGDSTLNSIEYNGHTLSIFVEVDDSFDYKISIKTKYIFSDYSNKSHFNPEGFFEKIPISKYLSEKNGIYCLNSEFKANPIANRESISYVIGEKVRNYKYILRYRNSKPIISVPFFSLNDFSVEEI